MKEKNNTIICSGCGAELGEGKDPHEISHGICDPCLKAIRGEEDLMSSEKETTSQELLPLSISPGQRRKPKNPEIGG